MSSKAYYEKHKDRINRRVRAWRKQHLEHYREQARGYTRKPEAMAARKQWRADNRLKMIQLVTNWRNHNRDKWRTYLRAYEKNRYATNIQFSLKVRIASRIRKVLGRSRTYKSNHTMTLLGTTLEGLKAHIESLFLPGMSWANRNLWHIDHVRPCAAFDLRDQSQQRACFHFSNLQPLWKLDNLRKADKWTQM